MIKKNPEVVATATSFDVIRRPVITEKAMKGSEHGQYVFVVDTNATKLQIKQAVEAVFNVKVTAVNTLRQEGKRKIFRGVKGVRSETKKAIVTLADGQSIDVTAGI